MDKILVVVAHPDDDILGCGGFIAKYHSHKKFKVVFLAEGTTCRFPPGQINSCEALAEKVARTNFAQNALQLLGVSDMVFYDNPCGRLDQIPILDLNKIIEAEIESYRPDTIFTHYEDDNNNDHRIVYRSVLMATRPCGLYHVPNLFSCEIQSSTEWSFSSPFRPNYFEVLAPDNLMKKWQALACYETEIREYPHPRSWEGVEALARYRGMQVGECLAEAFTLVRRISK
jgi:LmbE family N-acetylglucosaminyl deacetylase